MNDETVKHEVWDVACKAIYDAVKQRLTAQYDNPLAKIVDQVVADRTPELKALIADLFGGAIDSEAFRVAAREQLAHKVAKCLMQKMEGAVEKAANTLRSDPACRAKILLAIEQVVAEHQPAVAG